MLYLYPKNTVDFTNNGDPIRYSFDEHVVRDEGFYLTFNLLLDKEEDYKKIKKEMIISADTPDGRNQFRVYDIKNKSTTVEVTAVQLMYDFDNKEVNPFYLKIATGSQVISRFKSSFKSTLGQFTMDSSVTETHDFTTNDEDDDTPSHNALEVLNRITDRWDSELMLNGFDIRMIKRLGAKTDALLYEKKNISEFEDASSVSGMITRIHATSKFTPEGKEDEVILAVTVDSPLINEYAQIYEKSYVNNDCRTEAELIAWTKLKYSTENVDKPSRSITVSTNIIDGTEINYGDDLVLKYLVHDVDEIIRCVGYDYDPIKNTYHSVTLGDWKDSFLNTVTSNIIDNTNKQLNQMKNSVTYIAMSANGKNRNAYGPEPVPNPINGDNWYYYEYDRPNDVELRIFQDGFWVGIDFATKKEVEAVLDQADLDRAKAEQEINQALTDAKTYTEVKAQEFNNQLLIVNQNVLTATNSANTAVLKADKAIEDVGFLKPDVATAKANAATAIQDATTATKNATTAIQNAQTALNSVATLSQEVDVSITNINGELTRKVSQTTFNTLSGTVGTHTTQISQTQTSLLAKAESSLVNTIKGTVDTHTTQIKVVSDGLELKAESSLVNTVKGTVDSHTTQINANSTAITARLTSAQIETLLTGKQYVNQTTLNATSTGLTAQITQVSTDLNNLNIGGVNLIPNSQQIKTLPNNNGAGTAVLMSNESIPYWRVTATTNVSTYEQVIVAWMASNAIVGNEYTIGVDVRVPNEGVVALSNPVSAVNVKANVWTRIYYTFKYTAGLRVAGHRYLGTQLDYRNWKLETGNKGTDWSPAIEDMATLEKVVTIEANIDGINTLVASKASQTQVTQLAGQLTTKVESATYNSKMTQLDSAINLRVVQSDVTAAILADKKIKDTRNDNQTPIWYNNNYAGTSVTEFKTRSVIGVPGIATFVQLETKSPWTGSSGGEIVQIANSSDGTYQRVSIGGLASWGAWDKIAEAGKLITQINLSTEGLLLQGKRIQLDGDVTMTSAFVTILDTKTLSAVTANIATIRSQVLIANVVDSTMLRADTATILKLFATDANVAILTAKTAFINSVKAIDIAADRITTGTLNASNVNIINLNASKIVASSLSALTTNTGALNVTDWLTFSTDNKGIRATYDFGDPLNNSFDPRWFLGSYTLGYRYMKFQSDVYTVNSSGGRGNFGYYAESYYGADYFKLRQFRTASNPELLSRTDMRAEYFSMSTSYTTSNIYLNANGDSFFSGNMQVGGDLSVMNLKALKSYYIQAPDSAFNLYINGGRNDLGSMRFGVDGSTLNGGRLISSDSIYNRTYSSSANVAVFDTGTIGRVVSARKYKLNIEANHLLETALKILEISPSSWFDKGEVESIAKTISNGTESELDPNFKLKRHYGFIADEFHEVGAKEVVSYNSKGEVEGLAYERISMYHHELIKDLYKKINSLENQIKQMESAA